MVGCGPALQYPTASRSTVAREEALSTQLALKLQHERVNRVARVYNVLRTANADLCGQKVGPVVGARIVDRAMFANTHQREFATNFYGLKADPKVIDVDPNSPADIAGLKAGDVILNFGIGNAPINEYSLRNVSVAEIQSAFEKAAGVPVTFVIARSGSIQRVELRTLLGCSYPIKVAIQPVFNAASDGSQIAVATGVFTVVSSDDSELAFVVAHELAHNALKHIEKMQGNAAIGGLLGLALDIGAAAAGVNTGGAGFRAGAQAGGQAYSKEFEHEADYLAIYILERAGYDPAKAPILFRRLSAEYPQQITGNYLSTHPSNSERIGAMQEAIEEISGKKARAEAILPTALPNQSMAVRPIVQTPIQPVVTAALPQAPAQATSTPSAQPTVSFIAGSSNNQPITNPVPPSPSRASVGTHSYAQLYLIKGPIVSNPPQTFNGEFLPTGKAQVILSGRRLLTGDFELFGISESVRAKYKPALVNPDNLKIPRGSDVKGFAALSDGVGTELECVYSLNNATTRGEGTCADNQNNTYRIIFD